MQKITKAPEALTPQRLLGIRRGLEKESLRALHTGELAMTPHPAGLGSALTHSHITTDFSESQVELITGVHGSVDACLEELTQVQRFTAQELGEEMLWASSMPCKLPADQDIPIGQYGTSNVGRLKSAYRVGLGNRYGRRMQTISGIHYNWSLPGVSSEEYFGLIRNFRRHAFLLLTLFGASPMVCSDFVEGRPHPLQPTGGGSMYLPHATSLRMGRLGYQSDAQASLSVSYNSLEGYANSLEGALTRPYPAYEALGVQGPQGDYRQLATTLLQIENEFYGTIRPKRVIFPGERPLHALRERGVEYVEVRLMDLDPFEPMGIAAQTMRFLDIFLLHCLGTPSPLDTPQEIEALGRNQHRVAERGREPGLQLERGGQTVGLVQWGLDLLRECRPFAQQLDEAHGTQNYSQALLAAQEGLLHPQTLPSARVVDVVQSEFGGSFSQFAIDRSQKIRATMLAHSLAEDVQSDLTQQAAASWDAQREIEAADTMPFDIYLKEYLKSSRLLAKPIHV